MRNSTVRPVSELGRYPEHGRIRFGVKTEKAMKVLDTFRFTSPDETAIRQIAGVYGGDVRTWIEPRANPMNQWQVITEASEIRVLLPPESLSVWYELWSAGGLQRRCDGALCAVPVANSPDWAEVDCLCKHEMKCRPHVRLNVILPEIRFGGVWRLDTKSWNAADEMTAMEQLLADLQVHGVIETHLRLGKRTRMADGKKRHYTVPQLVMGHSPDEITSGAAGFTALHSGVAPLGELDAGGADTDEVSSTTEISQVDDEIVDAEIVEEPIADSTGPSIDRTRLHTALVVAAKQVAEKVEGDQTKIRHAVCRVVTQGRTASSRNLSKDEGHHALDILNDVIAGTRIVVEIDGKTAFRKVSA